MIRVPVYSDENQLHHVSIFEEEQDGTFKRTQSEPLRLLRDNIEGISTVQGELVSNKFDKNEREWNTPTVSFHYGRPQSFYQFIREKVAFNKFYVFTKPNLSGRIVKFELHELKLKPSTSQKILKLLKEKYLEAVDLWTQEQLQSRTRIHKNAAGVGSRARQQSLTTKTSTKRRALEKLQDNRKRLKGIKGKAKQLMQYDNLTLAMEGSSGGSAHADQSSFSNYRTVNWQKRKRQVKKVEEEENHFYQRFVTDTE